MKKFFCVLMLAAAGILWGCGKDDGGVKDPNEPGNPDNPEYVELGISEYDLVLEAQGGEGSFEIYCNTAWTIVNESEWCKTDKSSGDGNATVTVSAEAYYENADRNTVLTVKAGDVTCSLTVT